MNYNSAKPAYKIDFKINLNFNTNLEGPPQNEKACPTGYHLSADITIQSATCIWILCLF